MLSLCTHGEGNARLESDAVVEEVLSIHGYLQLHEVVARVTHSGWICYRRRERNISGSASRLQAVIPRCKSWCVTPHPTRRDEHSAHDGASHIVVKLAERTERLRVVVPFDRHPCTAKRRAEQRVHRAYSRCLVILKRQHLPHGNTVKSPAAAVRMNHAGTLGFIRALAGAVRQGQDVLHRMSVAHQHVACSG